VTRVGVLLCAVLMLAGCDGIKTDLGSGLRYFRDSETGCQYVAISTGEYLTPRLSPDGKPMCGEKP